MITRESMRELTWVGGNLVNFVLLSMTYKHIFFDLDHTLWDFETNARETLLELYSQFNLSGKGIESFPEFHERYSFHNDILWERFRKGYISRDLLRWKRMFVTLLDFRIADEPLSREMGKKFLEILPTRTHLFPHALEILDYLGSKNYPLHLITNGFELTQQQKLDHSGIARYFTHMITSEKAGTLKPHRGIFDFALKKVHISSGETVMIGDTYEVDIIGAMEAGMDQVWFNPAGYIPVIKPTYTISSLQELTGIL